MAILCRVGAAVAAAITMLSRQAAAAPERFGEAGQLVIDQSFLLAASSMSFDSEGLAEYRGNQVTVAPVVSWFAARRVSLRLGARVMHYWASAEQGNLGHATNLGVSPGVGYALPLGQHLSVWPRLNVDVGKTWYDAGDFTPSTSVGMSLGALAPVLWHPADHFFIGLGPGISWQLDGERLATLEHSSTTFLLMSTLGGYFSL
jgi:hypothetical protein